MTAELDPERRLALVYVPRAQRPALEALWRLDVTLGSVLATGSDPMISRIRLAWWREALERLDREKPPAEPMLERVACDLMPAGISGAELAAMEEGWAALTEPALGRDDLRTYAERRGGLLFRYSARLLGEEQAAVVEAGQRWALVDLARRSGRAEEVRAAIEVAKEDGGGPVRWPRRLGPIGMLAVLADRDIARGEPELQGSPSRIWRMFGHRLTGR